MTMVIFLSTGMLKKLSEELIKGGYEADTPAAIVYKATYWMKSGLSARLPRLQRRQSGKISKTA